MGKHRKSDDMPTLTTPQEKADSFDRQYRASVASADAKREARDYPYHYDHLSSKK